MLGFYAVSTVFQLFNGDSSQIHVYWTIFNQHSTIPLSWHSRSAVAIILRAKGGSQFLKTLVCRGLGSNPRPPANEVHALTTRPPRRSPRLTHQQLSVFENSVGKGEIARDEQFLPFPQCFLLKQKIVPPFIHIFAIISLLSA